MIELKIASLGIIGIAIIWFLWKHEYGIVRLLDYEGKKYKGETKEDSKEEYPEDAYLENFVTYKTLIDVIESWEKDTEELDNRVKELELKLDIIIKYNNIK